MTRVFRTTPGTIDRTDAATPRAIAEAILQREGYKLSSSYSEGNRTPIGQREDGYVIPFAAACSAATPAERRVLAAATNVATVIKHGDTNIVIDRESASRARMIRDNAEAWRETSRPEDDDTADAPAETSGDVEERARARAAEASRNAWREPTPTDDTDDHEEQS